MFSVGSFMLWCLSHNQMSVQGYCKISKGFDASSSELSHKSFSDLAMLTCLDPEQCQLRPYFPLLYWLFNKDPYNGLLYSPI